jgi:amino acid transporter
MSRDNRFPGHPVLKRVSPRTGTPLAATGLIFVVTELILLIFAFQTGALFTLFGAATLLPAVIYAATVLLYILKRKQLPPSRGFTLGRFEIPVIVIAALWLAYQLLIFRDASFGPAWLYVLAMVVLGGIYLAVLLSRGAAHGLAMPTMASIDRTLDADAARAHPGAGKGIR